MSLKIGIVEKMPGYHEIALEGRLDTETYAELEKAAAGLLAGQARGIRLDMTKLAYISSMGLRVVMKIMKDLKARKGAFQLTNLQPQIKKVFDIAAAMPPQTVFSSVEEADAYFDAMQKKALGQGPELE
jgi:anti-anti-sigma factor